MSGLILLHCYSSDETYWVNADHIVRFSEKKLKGRKESYTFVQLTTCTMDVQETEEQIINALKEV